MRIFARSGILALFLAGLATVVHAADTPKLSIEGKIVEVIPSKKEIYIRNDDGKFEFYFTEQTKVTKQQSPAEFSSLLEGQNVRVETYKIGRRYDPIAVDILE